MSTLIQTLAEAERREAAKHVRLASEALHRAQEEIDAVRSVCPEKHDSKWMLVSNKIQEVHEKLGTVSLECSL